MFILAVLCWLGYIAVAILGRREYRWYENALHIVLALFVYFSLYLVAVTGAM